MSLRAHFWSPSDVLRCGACTPTTTSLSLLPGLHLPPCLAFTPESLPYLLTDQHLLSTHCALGSTLGAWETLAIRITQDVPRFVPISTKRAREKVEKRGSASKHSTHLAVGPVSPGKASALWKRPPAEEAGEPRAGGGN